MSPGRFRLWLFFGLLAAAMLGGCRPLSAPRSQNRGETVTPTAATDAAPRQTPTSAPRPPHTLSLEQARAILLDAARAAPRDPRPLLELAMFEWRAGDLAGAERRLTALWKQFPNYPRAPYQLGMLYMLRGNLPAALAPLRAAARLAPEDYLSQVNAGYALLWNGYEQEAKRQAEIAQKLDPEAPDAYLLLAFVNDHHGTSLKAIEYAQEYAKRSPNPTQGLYLIGRSYARQGNGAEAERWLKRALEVSPDIPELWLTLGRVYYEIYRSTRMEEAIQALEKARELAPNRWEVNLWLGRARLSQGRAEEAVLRLREALSASPQPGPIYYDLGQALLKAGLRAEGQKALATYQAYREYVRGMEKMRAAIDKEPRRRDLRYQQIRFCIAHRQYGSALSLLREAERLLGADETLRQLKKEAEARLRSLSPPPSMPGGAGDLGAASPPGSFLLRPGGSLGGAP